MVIYCSKTTIHFLFRVVPCKRGEEGDKGLDKDTSDTNGDKATVQSELDAVNEYYTGIKARCIAKAETYADRTARRAAEIAGLKEALTILDGEAVLLQRTARHTLRGARQHGLKPGENGGSTTR